MKTFSQKTADIKREWILIDASENTLGRVATVIANYLTGKSKVTFTPHTDGGDYVVVINAAKVQATGNKEADKMYYRHSGYTGNIKSKTLGDLRAEAPEKIIYEAVKGMIPRNKLAADRLARLKIFADAEHTHTAQQPKPVSVKPTEANKKEAK